jgi:hypothetical protein
MRKRKRVEAELAVTNSLGIRDNLYAGPLTQESMFNVFPFENTINLMYLSGTEIQEMLDFVSERSASRGCVSQAQVSGVRFTMDCAQVQLNTLRTACDPNVPADQNGKDCPDQDRGISAPWQCISDISGGRCWAHPAIEVAVNGKALDPFGSYRVAVNDFIAKGGSGFAVLKRNTTRIETGIALRDSLIGFMQNFCNCQDLLNDTKDNNGFTVGKNGQLCGQIVDGKPTVDPQAIAYCRNTERFEAALYADLGNGCTCQQIFREKLASCPDVNLDEARTACYQKLSAEEGGRTGPALGKCSCLDALAQNPLCGHVTSQVRAFCETPLSMAVAEGIEDGRIKRKIK